MKAVTANLLADGRVVYLGVGDGFVERLRDAARFEDAAAKDALARTLARGAEIAGAYLIDVAEDGAPAGREAWKESIRNAGPTVRPDLGKQAAPDGGATSVGER